MALDVTRISTLAFCIGLPVLVGALSGFATAQGVHTWYPELKKPFFNPPDSLFGPVWTVLYILMGISLYRIWNAPPSPDRLWGIIAFGIQLTLNFAWSFLFFYFRQITLALGEIMMLWASVLAMILFFFRVDQTAALLQIPYLLWVAFATLLNAAIRVINPDQP